MGTVEITVWLPVTPTEFAAFLGVATLYVTYSAAKFIISLWTGA